MRILLIAGFFPPYAPVSAVRAPRLAKYLLDRGHDVRVLAPRQDRFPPLLQAQIPEERICWTETANRLQIRSVPGSGPKEAATDHHDSIPEPLRVVRKWLARTYRSVTEIPDPSIGWLRHAARAGSRPGQGWKPDLIYATTPPHTGHLVARRLSRAMGVPWVAELRDLWTQDPYFQHPPLPFWREPFERWLEARTLRTAAGLVAVTEEAARLLRLRFGENVIVVRNGLDESDLAPPEAFSGDPAQPLNLVHTGAIYAERRDPERLFCAVAEDRGLMEGIRMHFYGPASRPVRALAEKYGVAGIVETLDTVPRDHALRAQREADALLLLTWPAPEEARVIPSKVFDYIAARRPILNVGLETGETSEIVRSGPFGLVAEKPEDIRECLQTILAAKRSGTLQEFVPKTIDANLTSRVQFSKLDAFLSSIADERCAHSAGRGE